MIQLEDYSLYVVSFLCGMSLIAFAMQKLSVGLQSFLTPLIRYFLNSLTTNYFISFIFGSLIAFSIQSGASAATMALSFSNSGLIRLNQLKMLLLGSNLGTVLTLFLFSFNFKTLDFYLIVIGFFPMVYAKKSFFKSIGKVIFSLGLLLIGQKIMMHYLAVGNFNLFKDYLFLYETNFFNSWFVILIGIFFSIFFRSALALLVGVMTLLVSGNIDLLTASFLILSINFGKAIPLLKLSKEANVVTKKGAWFHLETHFLITLVALILVPNIVFLIKLFMFSLGLNSEEALLFFVPTFHLFYNLVVILFGSLFFVPLSFVVNKLVKESETKENQKLVFIGNASHMSPSLAIEQVFQEIKKMAATIQAILQQTLVDLIEDDVEAKNKVLKYEKITDNIQVEIYDFLDKVMEVSLTSYQGRQIRSLSKLTDELERIADACKSISLCKKEIVQFGGKIDGEFLSQLEKAFDHLLSIYEIVFSELTEQETYESTDYRKRLTKFEQYYIDIRKDYLEWLQNHASSTYEAGVGIQIGDILFNLRKICSHSINIHQVAKKLSF